MTPQRTRSKAATATLPGTDGPLGQEEFIELCQTNPLQLWERMLALHDESEDQIEMIEAQHQRDSGDLLLMTVK
jgi:hypothetical protein